MANRRKDKLLKRVTISVDPTDYSVLEGIAEGSGVSAAWLIRRSIREFLVRHSTQSRSHPIPLEGIRFTIPEAGANER